MEHKLLFAMCREADLNLCPFSRLAGISESVIISIENLESPVCIINCDIGAAGLALGNGWLFPGTYSRLESFRRGAKKGVKIVIGTVPVFVMAGFIEGFVTRHTELPDLLRLGFILLSLSFIIFYYIYLPNRKKHGITET